MPAILGVILALVLLLKIFPLGIQEYAVGIQTVRAHEVASQARTIALAVQNYVQSNYAAILAGTKGGPQTIPLSALITTGFLPAGTSAVNAYDQTWQVSFYQPAKNDIDALVNTVGGRPVHPDMLPELAAQIGQEGGFQPVATGLYQGDGGDAIGAFGGWKVPVTSFGLAPQPGTPSALVYFNSGTVSSTYLYRVAVPGNPQVNTMQTNLNTGGNAVTNTGTVQFTTNPASGVIYQGEACSQNGAIGTNSNGSGQLMACQGGTWQPAAPTPKVNVSYVGNWTIGNGANGPLAWASYCSINSGATWGGTAGYGHSYALYPVAGPNAQGQYLWWVTASGQANMGAVCFDLSN